jgi:hypothetical protein
VPGQVVARSLLFLALVVGVRPYRNAGVQRWTAVMGVLRAVVLCLSVAFIPAASTRSAHHMLTVGYAVAALHVVCCVGLASLSVVKVVRTLRGRHGCGHPSEATAVASKVRVLGSRPGQLFPVVVRVSHCLVCVAVL